MTAHPVADRVLAGARLALATLTVAPVRAVVVDRTVAGIAMTLAPAAGVLLGLIAAAVGLGLAGLGVPILVAAVLTVATVALLTRGLHLDGLADTADGLGSYRDADTALSIMRKPDVGPFGVVVLVMVLLTQVAAVTALLGRPWYVAAAGIATAVATGRLAITFACRRGVAAARPDGMGAIVAGTVGPTGAASAAALVGVVALAAGTGRLWLGPVAVTVGVIAGLLVTDHAVRRLGGLTGDVLGAACEVATTATYVALSMS